MSARTCFLFDVAEAMAARLALLGPIARAVAVADPGDVSLMRQLPAALVYPLIDAPGGNLGGRAAAVQRVSAELGVVHVVPVRDAPGGEGHVAVVGAVIEATRDALAGWTPCDQADNAIGAASTLALAGGALEDIADGRLYWLDRYGVEWVLDSQRVRSG